MQVLNGLFTNAPFTPQRIRISPGKLILVKISPDSGRLHGKHAKENQTLFTFLTAGNSRVQTRSVFKFVQLCCEFTGVNELTP